MGPRKNSRGRKVAALRDNLFFLPPFFPFKKAVWEIRRHFLYAAKTLFSGIPRGFGVGISENRCQKAANLVPRLAGGSLLLAAPGTLPKTFPSSSSPSPPAVGKKGYTYA